MTTRVYLVIMDETKEAQTALRFAALRAAHTCSAVHILALVQPQNFNAFGSVQATIEQEARDRAEVLANSAAGNLEAETGRMPTITVEVGDGISVIRKYLEAHTEVAALVLASGANAPGPLVTHFSTNSSALPCPLYIIPGVMSAEDMDRLA